MTTYCADCEHCHVPFKGAHPGRWLCRQCPNTAEMGFGCVTPTTWDGADPFMRCVGVNGGACKLFERRHDTQTRLFVGEEP